MSENKVAACLITGDDYKIDQISKLFDSLEHHVDAIFVNYNGTKSKLNWQKYTKLPLVYKKFKWEDDFALARNQSFALVPRDEFDWYLWIDTDDILVGEPDATEKLFASLDEYTEGVFLKYEYATDPETGIVVVEQWRERILSTKVDWNWTFPIHEVCRSEYGIQYAKRDELVVKHQRLTGDERGARDRNRKIIMKAAEEFPEEPRYQFYLAGETLAEAEQEQDENRKRLLVEAAITAYQAYRSMVKEISDDVYLATSRLAELHRMNNDYSAALEADLECIAIYPDWPDGYVGAAKSCLELADWPRMKSFADMATKCVKPDTAASIEPIMSGFTPLFLRAMANEELGNVEQALDDYKAARELWNPPGGHVDRKISYLETYDKEKPKDERWSIRKKLRGTNLEKSICFFTQPIPETWHPKTLAEGGHGGAETCIMKLAPMFAADGWRTVVFGTPGPHRGVYEGVEYWQAEEFSPKEKFKVLISSRSTAPFLERAEAEQRILWMHDVNIGPQEDGTMRLPDKIVGLTNWHSKHLQNLYDIDSDKLFVVPNGVDMERFDKNTWDKANKFKFIYSSSPDRGLDTLLGLWPIIKHNFAEAELHIYYGWEMIDRIISTGRKTPQLTWLEEFKYKCLTQIKNIGGEAGGIYQHGRINQNDLAKEMAKCSFWLYPTDFMETFCITAVEMQMSGVIPVVSNLAALTETINPNVPKIEGWPKNTSYQKEFLTILNSMLGQDKWQEFIRNENYEFASKYSWENAYAKWNDLIKA